MLGLVLDGATLEGTFWGPRMQVKYDRAATALEREGSSGREQYVKAEESYRTLRQAYDAAGLRDLADLFYRRAMTMRRMQIPKTSVARTWSWLVDVLCGYGVIPHRVIFASLIIVLATSVGFFFAGLEYQGETIRISTAHSLLTNAEDLVLCIYFSMVSFTTIGYGDIHPLGLSRLIGAIEGFIGVFLAALFVVTFGQKMLR